jgi:hypothetical protein
MSDTNQAAPPTESLADIAARNEGSIPDARGFSLFSSTPQTPDAQPSPQATEGPGSDEIRAASARYNALKADAEWVKRLESGQPAAVKEFGEITGTLNRATTADLALAGISPDQHWDRGSGDEMSLRDVTSVVNDLRNTYMFDEPTTAQIVRNEPITRAEQRMAQVRARELATSEKFRTALASKELWAMQALKLQAYLLNAPLIQEN